MKIIGVCLYLISAILLLRAQMAGAEELPLETEIAVPGAGFDRHEFWLGRWSESGVGSRFLTDYFGNFKINPTFSIEVGASLSLVEQVGPSMLGLAGKFTFPKAQSQLVFGIQHERWPSWQVTENRLEFYWRFFPTEKFTLAFGLAYRTPQYAVTSWVPFANWSSDPNGEFSILYAADWRLITVEALSLSLLIWDYDHMRLFTMDNVHFTLKAAWEMERSVRVYLAGTAGLTGVSGGILSWSQSIISTGLVYEL